MPESASFACRQGDHLLDASSWDAVAQIVAALRLGEIVSFPTDTVYALAASLRHPEALGRLYVVKGRPESKPIPVLLSSAAELSRVTTDLDPAILRFVDRYWPGQLTIVVPARPGLPPEITATAKGAFPTVAVRVPDHPLALSIIEDAGGAVAATSANITGQAPGLDAAEVRQQLGHRIGLILDGGRVPGSLASTIVEIGDEGLVILRHGGISGDEVVRGWNDVSADSA
jgi:L-threonylcarbamoyladenylate synthase